MVSRQVKDRHLASIQAPSLMYRRFVSDARAAGQAEEQAPMPRATQHHPRRRPPPRVPPPVAIADLKARMAEYSVVRRATARRFVASLRFDAMIRMGDWFAAAAPDKDAKAFYNALTGEWEQ